MQNKINYRGKFYNPWITFIQLSAERNPKSYRISVDDFNNMLDKLTITPFIIDLVLNR